MPNSVPPKHTFRVDSASNDDGVTEAAGGRSRGRGAAPTAYKIRTMMKRGLQVQV
jgi:hypothetical protein